MSATYLKLCATTTKRKVAMLLIRQIWQLPCIKISFLLQCVCSLQYELKLIQLDHPRKGLINIQNTNDNECFKWCLVRYLNPADHLPARITEADKDFEKTFDFMDIKFPVKTIDIHKIEKKNSLGISAFGY